MTPSTSEIDGSRKDGAGIDGEIASVDEVVGDTSSDLSPWQAAKVAEARSKAIRETVL
jgi:hypothetical protein